MPGRRTLRHQYIGIEPDDTRMQPYWALATIWTFQSASTSAPGHPCRSSNYRARRTLEVLVRHPRLRVYIMHWLIQCSMTCWQ